MAQSPAHKFGQIIGDVLEAAVEPSLRAIAERHALYLDRKGSRGARKGRKVSWTDHYGNVHDLDYVLEQGGTAEKTGTPVAFIETAWRRYTKHSRNKAQEIQGAILPLRETYSPAAPFVGVVLAGVFTVGALAQLRSLGFSLIYFPYETVIRAFDAVGIDARFWEETPDREVERKVDAWRVLSTDRRSLVAQRLFESNIEEVRQFMERLERAITRRIELVRVLPLHGTAADWNTVEEAIRFIAQYNGDGGSRAVVRYEVEIRYSNGDRIEARFVDKEDAIEFLRRYLPLRQA